MAVYPFLQDSFVDKSLSSRQQILETINKLRIGDSFQAFKEKFILDKNITITDEELKKLYISYNFMNSVIKKIVSYCPNLNVVKTRDDFKRRLIKEALNEIDWKGIENENYDTLESKGDSFFEIYFNDQEDKTPRLRVLDSKNMIRAVMDSMNRYKQYVYKEWVEDSNADYATGNVTTTRRERIIIYERGRKIIFDPMLDDNGIQKLDKDNKKEYNVEIIQNRDSYINDFPLIHIKGYKKQREEFSEVPASEYIDPSLTLDSITSDVRQINRMLGYPLIIIVDGVPVAGAERTPGGLLGVTSTDNAGDKQAIVKDIQISNRLDSVFKEFNLARDDLYDKAGLMTPTLREKLNIDSSRVIQQLNLPSENKIELYVDNTIKETQLWFKILLKENDMYSEETDKNIGFMKPKFIIKSSAFDELLYEQSEIKSNKKSKQEIYIESDESDKDIELRKKEINEELGDDNKDKSFASNELVDKVANGQNVDKNMISN